MINGLWRYTSNPIFLSVNGKGCSVNGDDPVKIICSPFQTGIYSKKKEFAPMGADYFSLE